jgi:serine/threonine-protein kinase RsbW
MAGFERAAAELRTALDASHIAGRARFQTELVFEEVVTNVIRHGRAEERPLTIEVSLDVADHEVVLTFEDAGQPFDPLQRPAPTLPASLEEAPLGGLGILMVRKAASRIAYERTADEKNRLTVAIATA